MKIYSLQEVYFHAKKHSDYYSSIYRDLPEHLMKLEDLPIVDLKLFWKMNSLHNNHVLTGPLSDAIVFKSGGTTGNPKFSVYTREEWDTFTALFGWGMARSAIQNEDRVANLFYAGDLYASFLFIHDSLEHCTKPSVNFPISGSVEAEHLADIINEFRINVLAGVPTTIVGFCQTFQRLNIRMPSINKIIFGGESIYSDQRRLLESVFPGVIIQSIGIASVDGGLLGYFGTDCLLDQHRCFDQGTIVEIVDDFGRPITTVGEPGQMLVTSLTRKLMPILRYPAGDRAMWTEKPLADRKYQILGRSEEGARVGPVTIYFDDVYKLLELHRTEFNIEGFQLVADRYQELDRLVLRVQSAIRSDKQADAELKILRSLYAERPMLQELVVGCKVAIPKVDWANVLEVNKRTGKLKRVIDLRKDEYAKKNT